MVDGRPPPQHLLYLIACCVVGLWVGVGWDDGREELECRATDGCGVRGWELRMRRE